MMAMLVTLFYVYTYMGGVCVYINQNIYTIVRGTV